MPDSPGIIKSHKMASKVGCSFSAASAARTPSALVTWK